MNYEMSDKQVEKLIRFNINKAIEKAFAQVREGKFSYILIEATLKVEIKRILKGEMIYWPTENDMI